MRYNIKTLSPLFFVVSLLSFLWTHCATPAPPGGGLKDSIPPLLMATSTLPNSNHFDNKRLTFYFNENITAKNINSEIIVNPYDKNNKPEIFYESNRLVFLWKMPLLHQMTYSIDLGKSIADNNEGNKINYPVHFAFTTGSILDTNILYGTTVVASTGLPDSTIIVTLYNELEDSAVMLKSPTYRSFVDTTGKYVFFNVKAGTYRLYAMEDKSNIGKYLSKKQLFGFADDVVSIQSPIVEAPRLRLFKVPEKKAIKKVDKKEEEDTLRYTMPFPAKLTVRDSLLVVFNKPIKYIDSSKVCLQLVRDSLLPVRIASRVRTGDPIGEDSTSDRMYVDAELEKGNRYTLFLFEGFAVDTTGNLYNKTDSMRLSTFGEEEYGKATILQDAPSYGETDAIFRIHVSRKGEKVLVPLKEGRAVVSDLLEGEYVVDLLLDENKNGKWDYGNFFGKKSQPEQIIPLEKKLKIKAEETTTYIIKL